ncbi:MAG: family 20 glycosylhydrolase [Bacteroidales bacterium]|nr:family 20 glycosylhydrolase [Bacteroidales bacterium]
MKKHISLLIITVLFLSMTQCNIQSTNSVELIPEPVSLTQKSGSITLSNQSTISISNNEIDYIITYLANRLNQIADIRINPTESNATIKLLVNPELADSIGNEGYVLKSTKKAILIEAKTEAGLFYGVQTFLQLVSNNGTFPIVEVYDYPRFAWRGYMLDVSRHFMPKEYIFKVLDYLAIHKLNTFHMHLVDDQGWRIEIKQYPKLTDIGAWRVDREHLHWNAREKQKPGEKASYGGFYTQDDIREIVAYAQKRQITIIPEIEMPGHTNAAIAAYPQYACTSGPFTVLPGGVWPITDIYCAGKDETFEFLQNILSEVLELFPSKYIHIGGDEAHKKEWKTCADCQKRIHDEGLKDEHELQSYFITRIEKFLNANGRQLIGWDEILEGGLAPNAAVMSWRGVKGGIAAAKSNHLVVMSPNSHCYFDYYQGKPELEPLAIGGFLPLEKVYSFEPIPEELTEEEAKYIFGVQANLWTEYVSTTEHADYMTFPRLCALAEVAWSQKSKKDFPDFAKRLNKHLNYLDINNIGYSKSFASVAVNTSFDSDNRVFLIELSNQIGYGEIRYTLDGTDPDNTSKAYTKPFTITKTSVVKAATFTNNEIYSNISFEKVWLHNATGAIVKYKSDFSEKYSAGGNDALTNSLRGSANLSDGRWQGFNGNDLIVTLDLGEEKLISSIGVGCLQDVGKWIFFPSQVEIALLKEDSNNAIPLFIRVLESSVSLQDPERKVHDFTAKCDTKARFIRITAKNISVCPPGHTGAGKAAWLFVDEIVVE